MVNLLRKHQQPVMIFITVVIIIAFVVFYNGNSSSKNRPNKAFQIYGRSYSQDEIDRKVRRFGVARAAGLNELVYGLAGNATSEDLAVNNFVLNSFILNHEAKRLGITVSDADVVNTIEKMPKFQTNGAFDRVKYQGFIENLLRPNGFTTLQFEDLVRDQVTLEKMVTLLGATADVTPAEFRATYVQNNQKVHASLITFDLKDFTAAIQPTEDEVKKFYEDRKASFTAPEKRAVSFVKLDLSKEASALKGKELVDARQALADRASDFGQALLEPKATFAETAKKMALEVKTTPEFEESQPPADLAASPQVAATAFKLTEKDPTSDAISVGNGYYILHLDKVTPSRPLTFEEAKPKVVEEIKDERGNAALAAKAREVQAKIAAELKAGKSFADATKEAGVKVEAFPAFSLAEMQQVQTKPNAQEIVSKAVELGDGELSDFIPVATGGLVVYVDKRDPIDEAQFEKEKQEQIGRTREMKSYIALQEWLQSRRKFADIKSIGQQRNAPKE